MAQTVQNPKRERIEIVDQPEEMSEQEQKRSWLRIPLVIAAIVALIFVVRFVIREKKEDF